MPILWISIFGADAPKIDNPINNFFSTLARIIFLDKSGFWHIIPNIFILKDDEEDE